MDSLEYELYTRKDRLEKAISVAEAALRNAPNGSLRVDCGRQKTHYAWAETPYSRGKYIPSGKEDLIGKLAQKSYAQKFLNEARQELRLIERFIASMPGHRADLVYSKLTPERQRLVTPYLLDADTYAQNWESQSFESNPNYPELLKYETRRGEKVRSKTELIIADTYFELGIPYRYECALHVRNGVVYYPDFTLLDTFHRRIVFHEHFGLIDDAEYRKKAEKKIQEYERYGIYSCKNLLLTYESATTPFDSKKFRAKACELFHKDM
ncbi:MAG: hypothetical protein J5379_09030 [Clostridiales bacterium]|nr:hypothetical protein [Clostridiales bacterium]